MSAIRNSLVLGACVAAQIGCTALVDLPLKDSTSFDTGIDSTDAADSLVDSMDIDADLDTFLDPDFDMIVDPDVDPDTLIDPDPDSEPLPCNCTTVDPCCDGCYRINGCWYDSTTGYIWEDPTSYVGLWQQGINYCEDLSLGGYSAGTWHLPTIGELRSLIRDCAQTQTGGTCLVTDDCYLMPSCCPGGGGCGCIGCPVYAGPGGGGCFWDEHVIETCDTTAYWSAMPENPPPVYYIWAVDFSRGYVDLVWNESTARIRCIHN